MKKKGGMLDSGLPSAGADRLEKGPGWVDGRKNIQFEIDEVE